MLVRNVIFAVALGLKKIRLTVKPEVLVYLARHKFQATAINTDLRVYNRCKTSKLQDFLRGLQLLCDAFQRCENISEASVNREKFGKPISAAFFSRNFCLRETLRRFAPRGAFALSFIDSENR